MIGQFLALTLIENQPRRALADACPTCADPRRTPRGVVARQVLLPLAVRPSPISGPSENSNLDPWWVGLGGLAYV